MEQTPSNINPDEGRDVTQFIHRARAPFRRLRWRLTLSYTAVTVGTLLVVVLILASFILTSIFLPNDLITRQDWITAVEEQVVPPIAVVLSNPPVNLRLLDTLITDVDENNVINQREFARFGQARASISMQARVQILIFGQDGALLAASDPGFVPWAAIGQPFDPARLPGLGAPLRAALAGDPHTANLFTIFEPNERFLFAVPVIDRDDPTGRVWGAVVVHIDALPTESDRSTYYIGVVTRSLLIFLFFAGLIGTFFGSITANGLVQRFRRLAGAADRWSHGDFTTFIHDPTGDEISQFAERLNTMARQTQALLKQRQEMAVAEERNRLGRDLHDSAKQIAFAASAQLGAASALFDQDPTTSRSHLLEAEKLVDTVRKELTALILELRPVDLDRGGLPGALRRYAADFSHHNDVAIDLQVQGEAALPLTIEQTLFRIAQEALANTARHSQARGIEVLLVYAAGAVTLTIADDGIGFDPAQPRNGLGLRSMRERAELIAADLTVRSRPGEGTTVSVTCPTPVTQPAAAGAAPEAPM